MVPEPFLLRVADKNMLQSIHEQSLELLTRAGVIFDNEAIVRQFVRKGQPVAVPTRQEVNGERA